MLLSNKLLEALEFASFAHLNQVRKAPNGYPYISHPYAVALILLKMGYDEEVVIAGLLHDVLEDTSFTTEDLKPKFGKKVVDYILGVTEKDKSLPWNEKKLAYRENLKTQPAEVMAISAADLLANRMDVLEAIKAGNNEIWAKFKATPQHILESDLKRISILKTKLAGAIIEELEKVINEISDYLINSGKIRT